MNSERWIMLREETCTIVYRTSFMANVRCVIQIYVYTCIPTEILSTKHNT